jgi:GLPGLI family protein
MRILIIFATAMAICTMGMSQQFISKAEIEYEVTTNIKKTMWSGSWADMLKENMSDFKTAYYTYTFADNKSLYKFNRWSEKTKIPKWYKDNDEENSWYVDFNTQKINIRKQVYGTVFVVNDTIPTIKWRFTNESREIAGFNCSKAVGKIFDSVYVFAFYTNDITISGGPCSISGLPGQILGLTIPRLYTSYIATKVSLTGIKESELKPIASKKYYTHSTIKQLVNEKIEDWYSSSGDEEEQQEDLKMKNLFLWNTFL